MARRTPPVVRARERGATLFVVVLAITLLTGVGLYTVHSATLSERAAGNGRVALQVERVTESYTVAALSKFRRQAVTDIQLALEAKYACESNAGLTGVACRQIPAVELTPPTGAPILATDSFGPLGTVSGGARVELTDVYQAVIPSAGTQQGGPSPPPMKFYRGTVTVIGQLNPAGVGSTACVENMMQVTGQHMIRTHMLFGPIGL
jgi:hypothetical protein